MTLWKSNFSYWCFPANIAKFLRTHILKNICKQLLLKFNESFFLTDHEIAIIILNLLWNTCFMCILLSDCTKTVVIRLTNKRVQITGSMNNLVWRFKKMRASVWEKKTSSQNRPSELNEGHSLWEINCSLWTYKDVSNKLLRISWHNYIVVE